MATFRHYGPRVEAEWLEFAPTRPDLDASDPAGRAPNTVATGFPFLETADGLSPEILQFLDAGDPPIVFTPGSAAVVVSRTEKGPLPHEHAG